MPVCYTKAIHTITIHELEKEWRLLLSLKYVNNNKILDHKQSTLYLIKYTSMWTALTCRTVKTVIETVN